MLSQELKNRVVGEVGRYIDIANQVYKPTNPFMVPTIMFDLRGRTAGMAHPQKWIIQFNSILLSENVEKFIARTVPHEVAHLVDFFQQAQVRSKYAFRSGKRSVHGPSWRAVMHTFGVQDVTRCHSYDVSNALTRKRQRFEYGCDCPGKKTTVGPKIHARILAGNSQGYRTRCCGHRMTAVKWIRPNGLPLRQVAPQVVKPEIEQFEPKSKFNQVLDILSTFPSNTTRAQFIAAIMQRCNMSEPGAQTYYYKAKKVLNEQSAA